MAACKLCASEDVEAALQYAHIISNASGGVFFEKTDRICMGCFCYIRSLVQDAISGMIEAKLAKKTPQ